MRITGGKARGIKLKVGQQSQTRPATDALREAIFSSIGPIIEEDTTFLDLFAGTGAYGLEALSRGALCGSFVEKDKKLIDNLKSNLDAVLKSAQIDKNNSKIHCADVFKTNYGPEKYFDLVFIDPPYELSKKDPAAIINLGFHFLKNTPNARLILELPADLPTLEHPKLEFLKRIGKSGRNTPNALIYTPTL